jgi:hypothetical protein
MIEGIRIEVKSEELTALLKERAAYHADKAAWYAEQIKNLKNGGLRPEHVSNDPLSGLERSHQDHQQKAALFSFLRDHVISGETYRLSENDLSRLEFISRYI